MDIVKDVVSKFFQPSFLFTDSPKRKRTISIEENNDEQQNETIASTTTNSQIIISKSKYLHQPIRDDESQLTDDEDKNQNVSSTEQTLKEIEQQKKRRRTTNFQQIHTANGYHESEKKSLYPTSTHSISSLSNRRIDRTTSNERIDRVISSTKRFNITSTYDPSKSPLFSTDNRKPTETTNLKSDEFSANYLLATSLTDRPQLTTPNSQQSSATLTNKNRLLSSERQMFGVNYASINSHRLPYIERLRRRTLQDCIRFNRTRDNELLSMSTTDEHKLKTNTSELNRTKVQEKECGIQCNILIIENSKESNKKLQRAFPPADIQYEALSVPTTEKIQSSTQTDSSIQTNSSITIEKIQSPLPTIDITKPKVLGNVTPFSWPKFARAQEEYAKKYPEKCTESISSTPIEKSNINTNTNIISKIPTLPFSSLHPIQSIWKCPSCTKEHPAQTASCSLCHGINPNYKKLSAIQSTITIEKESTIPTPTTTIINQTTKESPGIATTALQFGATITKGSSVVTATPQFSSAIITAPQFGATTTKESSVITAIPQFGTATTKESPMVTAAPQFGITSTKENPVITAASQFGTTTTKESPVITAAPQFGITTTKENPVITAASQFGTTVTKESSVITAAPQFGITATKETPVITAAPQFGTTATKERSAITAAPQFGTTATEESPVVTTALQFGITTTKETPVITAASHFGATTTKESSVIIAAPQFGITTTTQENPMPTNAFRPQFGITPVVSPVVVTKENPTPNSTLPVFGTATTKESFSTTSTNNPFQIGTTLQPFSSVSSTSLTTAVTSSTTPSVAIMSSSGQLPFAPFGSTSMTTTTTTAAPISSDQSVSLTQEPTTSSSVINPIFFDPSTITSASSTTNSFLALPTTSTTSVPFQFGTIGFSFPSTLATTQSNPPFGFTSAVASPSRLPLFGTTPFGITSTSVDKIPSSSNSAPFTFGFGSTSNTTTNPIQTSTTSAVPTGGFSFAPQASTVPAFGIAPSALSSVGSSSSFNFGTTSTASTPFQATGTTSMPVTNNPFSTSTSSGSTIDPSNPFSITSDEASKGSRQMLRAKRRQRN
ncbi:unnamed protein product [Rotaria sordida]|uniref:RanBP2-type domain-containing protein n=1 Tax=Rotaria sordida TaxID=392033 RepID=A0A819C4N0_9BILA|nr:unnamed protein product [Rotaria sordida]